MSILNVQVPASDLIYTAKRTLQQHYTTFLSLSTQFEQSLPAFQVVYTGPASVSYHTVAAVALGNMKTVQDHLGYAAQQHQTMADNFDTANECKSF